MSSDESSSGDYSETDSRNSGVRPAGDSNSDNEEFQVSFASYQMFVFAACFCSYGILLYNRQSFTFSLQYIVNEKYFSAVEVGAIVKAQMLTYGISKFFCSWSTDSYSPRIMLAIALFFTGFIMIAFPDQDGWLSIMLLTASNGVAQGFGWPAVTKMIRAWYPPTQFGFWFALLASAATCVSAVGPGISSALAVQHGWQAAIQIPALMAIGGAPVAMYCTWDKPSDVGYEDQITLGGAEHGHWSDLTGSDFMMVLVSTFSFLFVVKTSCSEWGHTYLVEERGVPYYIASSYFTAVEVGGLIGSLLLGITTDFMIRRNYYFGTGKSPRMIIVQVCVAGSCLFLNAFLFGADPDVSKAFVGGLGFFMGFCMYGAISLIGTIAVEVAPIHMTGAAHAIIGLAASFGTLMAGTPMAYVATTWDWSVAFMFVNVLCLIAFIILVISKDMRATFLQEHKGGPPKLRLKPKVS